MKFLGPENIYSDYKKSRVAVIPVPYEKTTSYGKGAKKGPLAILRASRHLEHYDIEEDKLASKIGISTLPALKNLKTPQALFDKIKKVTDKVLKDKKIPVYLGGEHTITAAIVSAVKSKYSDFTVLHMDAHSDMRDIYKGNRYSHACVMRRVFEMALPVVSAGIRSQCFKERLFIKQNRINVFYAHRMINDKKWMKQAIGLLRNNFYLTFDVDVLDPSCMARTGAPEPGGLGWYQVVEFFKALGKSDKRLLGMDVVELAPAKDDAASSFLCAKLVYKILTLLVK